MNSLAPHSRSVLTAIASALCLSLAAATSSLGEDATAETIKLQVHPETVLARIPDNFIGFGYETSAVAQSNYFSAKNTTLIRLYRNLSTHGLIRIGGIISDHTQFQFDGTPVVQTLTGVTVINRQNLADLGAFARATGWQVMWGLNLGTGSREEAVQQALAVRATVGANLQSFQIGNEVEALRRFNKSYDAYHAAFLDYKFAIRATLPNAPFSGPDSIGNWSWITNFAAAESHDLKLITHHYYRGGAKDPATTLQKLLTHDDHWDDRLDKLRTLSTESRVPYRINEINSFSGGGKPGVSDTFGAALWCLDYLFILASHSCEGVNMETDINQLGFISHYSPIVHDDSGHCTARPEYYGMLAFALAGKGELLALTMDQPRLNLSAYATRDSNGAIWITIVNKDFTHDAVIETILSKDNSKISAYRLSAPSMESKDHVILAGATVADDGTWSPGMLETPTDLAHVSVPHASAVLLQIQPN